MTNDELIAEARDIASGRWQPHPDDLAQFATAVVAALEAQPAPRLAADDGPVLAVHLEGKRWGYDLSATEAAHIAEAALEARPAPLVADSREAMRLVLESDACWMHDRDGDGWVFDAPSAVDALLASGVVSLAADRDRATAERAWGEGYQRGWSDRHEDAQAGYVPSGFEQDTPNPYRESEGK